MVRPFTYNYWHFKKILRATVDANDWFTHTCKSNMAFLWQGCVNLSEDLSPNNKRYFWIYQIHSRSTESILKQRLHHAQYWFALMLTGILFWIATAECTIIRTSLLLLRCYQFGRVTPRAHSFSDWNLICWTTVFCFVSLCIQTK